MKKKIIIALTAVFVLGLTMAVFAFNQMGNNPHSAASSKMENCPLKNKTAAMTTENGSSDSCCDKADCCCKSGACPMKAKDEKSSADCCANCCGGSCPMKNKQSETAAVQTESESCQHNKKAGS